MVLPTGSGFTYGVVTDGEVVVRTFVGWLSFIFLGPMAVGGIIYGLPWMAVVFGALTFAGVSYALSERKI